MPKISEGTWVNVEHRGNIQSSNRRPQGNSDYPTAEPVNHLVVCVHLRRPEVLKATGPSVVDLQGLRQFICKCESSRGLLGIVRSPEFRCPWAWLITWISWKLTRGTRVIDTHSLAAGEPVNGSPPLCSWLNSDRKMKKDKEKKKNKNVKLRSFVNLHQLVWHFTLCHVKLLIIYFISIFYIIYVISILLNLIWFH